ncbi:hypothetical protein BH23PAT1_BH23PAT1_4740 [soil metagenome]
MDSGKEAYFYYAAGLAIINNPEGTHALHGKPVESARAGEILLVSEVLILRGLKDIIRYSNPPERRSSMGDMTLCYEEAFPNMNKIRKIVYDDEEYEQRLKDLNFFLPIMRPLATRDEAVYKAICHGRMSELKTSKLFDGFGESGLFSKIIETRTMAQAAQKLGRRPAFIKGSGR